jgi:hypothetical protein
MPEKKISFFTIADDIIIQTIKTCSSLGEVQKRLGLSKDRRPLKAFIIKHNIDISHFSAISKRRVNFALDPAKVDEAARARYHRQKQDPIVWRQHLDKCNLRRKQKYEALKGNPDAYQAFLERENAKERERVHQQSLDDPEGLRAFRDKSNAKKAARLAKLKEDPVGYRAIADANNRRLALARSKKQNRAKFIVKDSRNADKKAHPRRENDLTVAFVEKLLAESDGCLYCGETKLRMTADRIDNDLGHLQSNVNPSCIRCNVIRGKMPYVAWMLIVPAVREARILGLFGDWDGGTRGSKARTEQTG